MAPVRITIESVGPGATIQDGGRHGWLRYGVTPAGPMDWRAHETANRALGNAPDAAAFEIALGGLCLSVDGPTPLAFAGGDFTWTRGETRLPAAARITLNPGERLRARAGGSGAFATCAVPGGVAVPPVMGSRSTHVRSALGGYQGRMLRAGDRLTAGAEASASEDCVIDVPWLAPGGAPLRIVLGPQDDHFSSDTIAGFLAATFTVTGTADRMAYKLAGPPLAPIADFNIVSDGVALGAIQIAGDGLPIILMADRQPTGGYAKIAHVARVDIGRLAQRRPGEAVKFAAVPANDARTALIELEDRIAATLDHLTPLRRAATGELLSSANLIGGVTDGSASDR